MEKILSITEVHDFELEKYYGKFDGFFIKTDKQIIKMGIENGQCCCEDFGYLMSEDDTGYFIGSELLSIDVVDKLLNNKDISGIPEYGLDAGGAMFINFNTSNGTLQFVAYNSHNGYYGHEAVIISKQLTDRDIL